MYVAKWPYAAFLCCKQFPYSAIRYNIWQCVFFAVCLGLRELAISVYDEAKN